MAGMETESSKKGGSRKRRTREQWAMELERYRQSGLGIGEYAVANGLNVGTLRWWGGQLGTGTKRGLKTKRRERAFVPLRATAESKEAPRAPWLAAPQIGLLEVALRNGRVVRAGFDADPSAIARLVRALEETSPC